MAKTYYYQLEYQHHGDRHAVLRGPFDSKKDAASFALAKQARTEIELGITADKRPLGIIRILTKATP